MLNQNTFDDVLQDFKFWEDPSDDFKVESSSLAAVSSFRRAHAGYLPLTSLQAPRGSVLPLWKFVCDAGKKLTVTSLRWNPRYKDLFLVTFGSYDFLKQSGILLC
jgi:dynein intermediate chain 1, axonemal